MGERGALWIFSCSSMFLESGEVKTLSSDALFFSPQATNTGGEEAGPGRAVWL